MQPFDHAFEWVDGRSCQGAGTLLMHVNAPFLPLAMAKLGSVVRDKFIVGSWAWELPRVPDEWLYGIPFVHEIWVPSSFVADAVRPIAMNRPVRIMFHPVAVGRPGSAAEGRSESIVFRVLTVFNAASSFARKNPFAAIRASQAAFGEDPSARLTIKVSNASLFKNIRREMSEVIDGYSNIAVLDRTVDGAELERLYFNSDVFMSLHRAEGFGLTLAEAMLYGLPVIATNWSGNVDFLNEQTGVPIPFQMVFAQDAQGTYDFPDMMWAEAEVDAAAKALQRLRGDPTLRKQIGDRAARHAREVLSAQAYASNAQRYLGLAP